MIFQRSPELDGKCATALLALRAAASWESSSFDALEPSAGASEVSSKIGRLLSTRGITLCRWKFAMTAAAVSSFLAKRCSALVRTSSLACCFAGDTTQFYFSGLSRSTLLVNAGNKPPLLRR